MAQPENPATPSTEPDRWLNRTVVGAGITSALGDFCYETTTVILPGFLAVLGLPAAVLGTIEGIADAVASFTRMVAGHIVVGWPKGKHGPLRRRPLAEFVNIDRWDGAADGIVTST